MIPFSKMLLGDYEGVFKRSNPDEGEEFEIDTWQALDQRALIQSPAIDGGPRLVRKGHRRAQSYS